MTKEDLDKPGLEGAKWVCSPPLRTKADQEALWQALALGDLQLVSSDHAPYTLDAKGKLRAGPNPPFKQIANGMPGLELRLPLLFDAMVSQGPLRHREVRRVDGDGAGEDVRPASRRRARSRSAPMPTSCIWDPKKQVTIRDEDVHDNTGYTPYAGRTIEGWPVTVLRRGEVIVEGGKLPGEGRLRPLPAAPGRRRRRADGPPRRRSSIPSATSAPSCIDARLPPHVPRT